MAHPSLVLLVAALLLPGLTSAVAGHEPPARCLALRYAPADSLAVLPATLVLFDSVPARALGGLPAYPVPLFLVPRQAEWREGGAPGRLVAEGAWLGPAPEDSTHTLFVLFDGREAGSLTLWLSLDPASDTVRGRGELDRRGEYRSRAPWRVAGQWRACHRALGAT